MGWSFTREQTELDFARHGDIFFELRFLTADGLIETGIFNGDCDLAGEGG
jgi:hypothetical protein